MKRLSLCLCSLVCLFLAASANAQEKYPQQWNFVRASLEDDAGMDKFLALMKQSKDCGCTHLQMNDSRWLKSVDDPAYQGRVAKVRALAKELGLTIVPSVYAFGYSGRYLEFDPNMGAGLPVKDMVFIVKGKTASPDPAQALDTSKLANGAGDYKVKPFSYYRISLYTKQTTAAVRTGFGGSGAGEPFRVNGLNPNRQLSRCNAAVKQEGDHWLSTTTFNTLDSSDIHVQVSVPNYESVKIEPAGAVEILRRDALPLKVTSEDGKTAYEEGKDFKKLVDPKLWAEAGDYDSDHAAPDIELTDNSAIKDGQKLLVSFYHAYKIYADQDTISLEDPKTFEIMEKDIAACVKTWAPEGFFMNYDEIRIAGWEPSTIASKITPGQLLAQHTKKGYDIIRKYSPNAKIYTWNDMYDSTGNARGGQGAYYLVNGNWGGAGEGLPKDIIIMSWNGSAAGMKAFTDNGHPLILCGYYDARNTDAMKRNIDNWKRKAAGLPNVLGFMYTQWGSGYDNLKEYFTLVDTYDQWKGALPPPTTRPRRPAGGAAGN